MNTYINKLISYKVGFPCSAEPTKVETKLAHSLYSSPGRCMCFTNHVKAADI